MFWLEVKDETQYLKVMQSSLTVCLQGMCGSFQSIFYSALQTLLMAATQGTNWIELHMSTHYYGHWLHLTLSCVLQKLAISHMANAPLVTDVTLFFCSEYSQKLYPCDATTLSVSLPFLLDCWHQLL